MSRNTQGVTASPTADAAPSCDPGWCEGASPFRLPRAQAQLWLADQVNPNRAGYLVPLRLRLRGPLDVGALRSALTDIVDRHEVLRTSVGMWNGEPAGLLRPSSEFTLTVDGLPVHHGDTAEPNLVEALRVAEEGRPMDLARDLPVRARLTSVGTDDHILSLTVHHVVLDEWSEAILFAELSTLYSAYLRGEPSPLPPLDAQYRDVAVLAETDTARDRAEQRAYWRGALADAEAFELPSDFPRPAARRGDGAMREFTVPEPVAARLVRLGRERGASLPMVLTAACGAVLARCGGRTDGTVGIVVALRDEPETERLIGPLINMLTLRTDIADDPDFVTLLDRARDTALDGYDNRGLPFDEVVAEMGGGRDPSRTPLFQVLLDFSVQRGRVLDLAGLEVVELPDACVGSKYDLSLAFRRARGGVRGQVTWDTALYRPATVDRFVRYLVSFLTEVAARPGVRVHEARLLTDDEHAELVASATGPTFTEGGADLAELFRRQVERTPSATALVEEDISVTYAELAEQSDQVAYLLREHGAGPDEVVAVVLERCVELARGVLGVLKAGAAYLPVDPSTPAERVREMLRTARVRTCLVRTDHADLVRGTGTVVLTMDGAVGRPAPNRPGPRVWPENLCAVYFTSGSTGRPKAVACTHRGWVNYMHLLQRRYRIRVGDAVVFKCAPSFDIIATELLWPLCNGGRVVVVPAGQETDARVVVAAAARHDAVQVGFVPTALRAFLEELSPKDAAGLAGLRTVVLGGEALPGATVERFMERFGAAVTLDNYWGTTETSVDSAVRTCRPEDGADPSATVTIGRPLDNHEVFILDPWCNIVPSGVTGELYVGGAGVARGYLHDPARTAERFVPHPSRPGQRLYRTGDRGRLRPDGGIDYLGRHDHQVKIRGVRIDLGEVEAALSAHPAVVAAAAVRQEVVGDERLVGYVVLDSVARATGAELRAHVAGRLLEQAVPSVVVVLDALPTLPNGKLDRAALPVPDTAASGAGTGIAPRNGTEETIAAIWAVVLGVAEVGVHDGFFQHGGHSLLVTRAVNRMRQAFGIDISMRTVFECPTVALAAARVDELLARRAAPATPACPGT